MKCATLLNPKKSVRELVAKKEVEMLKTRMISFEPNPEALPTIELISTSEIHQPNDRADEDLHDFEAGFRNAFSEASASTNRSCKTT